MSSCGASVLRGPQPGPGPRPRGSRGRGCASSIGRARRRRSRHVPRSGSTTCRGGRRGRSATRPGRRERHERRHVGVAADDPVEGDDVGRLDRRRERDEVADLVGHHVGAAAPRGLVPCRRDECRRHVHVDRRCRARVEQLQMDRPDARPDVEHGPARPRRPEQAVEQPARRLRRPRAAELREILAGVALAELVAAAQRAGAQPGSQPGRLPPVRRGPPGA